MIFPHLIIDYFYLLLLNMINDKPLGDMMKYKAIGRADSYEPVMFAYHEEHGFHEVTDVDPEIFSGKKARNFEILYTIE